MQLTGTEDERIATAITFAKAHRSHEYDRNAITDVYRKAGVPFTPAAEKFCREWDGVFDRVNMYPDRPNVVMDDGTHYLIDIRHNDVLTSLINVIEAIRPYLLLVFASKKETANELYAGLRARKYKAAMLTGDLDARERKSIIRRVKDGEFYILVCSDMAARGLDIPDVSDVINVDLPNNLEFYYHRAGRTGRFNKTGILGFTTINPIGSKFTKHWNKFIPISSNSIIRF